MNRCSVKLPVLGPLYVVDMFGFWIEVIRYVIPVECLERD